MPGRKERAAVRADAAGTVWLGGELEVARSDYDALWRAGQPATPHPNRAGGIQGPRHAVELGPTLIGTGHTYRLERNEAPRSHPKGAVPSPG